MRSIIARAIEAVNVEELPLDGPTGWVILAISMLVVPFGALPIKLGVARIRLGYRMLVSDPIPAGDVINQEGQVEVEGVARTLEETVTGKYSGKTALVQSWKRERRREKTDDDGNTTTEWNTVSEGTDSVPFLIEDDSGTIAVDPSDAQLSITRSQLNTSGLDRDRRYREYEGWITPADTVYVYGEKRTEPTSDSLGDEEVYIGDGDNVSRFVVSDGSELRTVFRYIGFGVFLTFVGVLWFPVTLIFFVAIIQAQFGLQIV